MKFIHNKTCCKVVKLIFLQPLWKSKDTKSRDGTCSDLKPRDYVTRFEEIIRREVFLKLILKSFAPYRLLYGLDKCCFSLNGAGVLDA